MFSYSEHIPYTQLPYAVYIFIYLFMCLCVYACVFIAPLKTFKAAAQLL